MLNAQIGIPALPLLSRRSPLGGVQDISPF